MNCLISSGTLTELTTWEMGSCHKVRKRRVGVRLGKAVMLRKVLTDSGVRLLLRQLPTCADDCFHSICNERNSIYSCSFKSQAAPRVKDWGLVECCGDSDPSHRLDQVNSFHLSSATNASQKISFSSSIGQINPAKTPHWGKNLYLFYLRESLLQDSAFWSSLLGMERVAGSSKHKDFNRENITRAFS